MRPSLSIVVVCALAASASGHGGGGYRGPQSEPPPDGRQPADPPPPPEGNGFEGWAFWWRYHEHEVLDLRRTERLARGGPREFDAAGTSARIAPALRGILADASAPQCTRSCAAIALAKLGDESIVPDLRRMALDADASPRREVRESAVLALGLLADDDPETGAFLADVVRGPDQGGTFVRPFAAVSLGMLGAGGRLAAASSLLDVVRGEAGADVKSACFLALGLVGDDAIVPELLTTVEHGAASDSDQDAAIETERSFAVSALGMIADGDATRVVDTLTALVGRRRPAPQFGVQRSAAIALGRIGSRSSPEARRRVLAVLRGVAEDGGADEQTRDFAIMSIARIGAAETVDARTRAGIVDFLGATLRNAGGSVPSYAALAIGLVGRAAAEAGDPPIDPDVASALRAKFLEHTDPRTRGAYAVASGLLRDPLAGEKMKKALEDYGADKRVRGWCALALGMIGDVRATDAVRTTFQEIADREPRLACVKALGLLGDPAVVDDLVAMLRHPDASNYERGTAALALGLLGDERAIGALLDVAVDADKFPDLTRALAVAALGEIGDRDDVPALARIASDLNYRAHVPAIAELLSIL